MDRCILGHDDTVGHHGPVTRGPLLCLDSASLYYRAYYALPESMTAPDGHPHNAVRGFLDTVTRLVTLHGPSAVAACWDEDWRPQWRVDRLPSYKTHRLADAADAAASASDEDTPDTLGPQIGAIADILDAAGIPRPGADDCEADDVIATLARRADEPVIVVTGDRDLVQVVRGEVRLLLTVNGGMDRWPLLDHAGVLERFGVPADRYVDLAILRGDPSDGIPGVPGFGAKTAIAVVTAFGSVEGALDAARSGALTRPLTPRLAGLLIEHADLIDAMRVVATARTDVPVPAPRHRPVADAALETLASEWGVTRQVTALRAALEAHTLDA